MNILHVGDVSGVASIMSNMCNRLGHPSVVLLDDSFDPWKHGDHYNNTAYCSSSDILQKVVRASKNKYDHIIYHNRYGAAAHLDDMHIPSSFMFHGDILRQTPELYHFVDSLESIDNLFVLEGGMKKYAPTAELFHKPVDMDFFTINPDSQRTEMALCFTHKEYLDYVNSITQDEEMLVLVADKATNIRTYAEMPAFLNTFKYYYDIKFHDNKNPIMIPELSQTGLQALACGAAVWSNGIWLNKFPDIHSDEWSCKQFLSVLLE